MRTLNTALIIITAVLFLSACAKKEETSDDMVHFDGTVAYIELEGGGWVIRSDMGPTYQPLNLPDEFAEDGVRVRVTGVVKEGMTSTLMVGQIIEIKEIDRL
jgi:hypothetical protein